MLNDDTSCSLPVLLFDNSAFTANHQSLNLDHKPCVTSNAMRMSRFVIVRVDDDAKSVLANDRRHWGKRTLGHQVLSKPIQ